MINKENNRQVGACYEELAAESLKRHGMNILFRNFRCRRGEIDIIGIQGGYLVFVEVKYRKANSQGQPEEAVGLTKQKKICQVAQYFLYTHPQYASLPVRYDVAAISDSRFRWYPAAFEHRE